MSSILVINAAGRETRVALVENGHIAEFYVERKKDKGVVGNIYKGRVTRVLPGMQAAFVDIGLEKAAFLYVSDVFYDPEFSRVQFELTEGEHEETSEVPEEPREGETDIEPIALVEGSVVARAPEVGASTGIGAAVDSVVTSQSLPEPSASPTAVSSVPSPAVTPPSNATALLNATLNVDGNAAVSPIVAEASAAPETASAAVVSTQPTGAEVVAAAIAAAGPTEVRSGHHERHRDRHRSEEKRRDRKPARIEDLLKVGQEVLVQISKDPIGTKGARLTSHISIPGRHLVFMPTVDHVGISRRISNEKERKRLREIVDRMRPPGTGFIVRTVAENVPQEKLEADIRFLLEVWNETLRKNEKRHGPGLMHPDLDLILRATRDLFAQDVEKLVIDDREEYERVAMFVAAQDAGLKERVVLHESDEPIFDAYGIEEEIKRALQRKVWLRSGGYLIIDQAEALTAIDVNSGRYVGKKSLEETITKINVEAAKEIVYQLRLRNIGGIIICDFIDMEKSQNRDKVFKSLQEALGRDKAKTNVLRISELGLVEMTRKRVRESIGRMMHSDCIYCDGTGLVKTTTTVAYEIFRELRRSGGGYNEPTLIIHCSEEVAQLLQGEERQELRHLMDRFNKSIQVRSQKGFHREQYDIFARTPAGNEYKVAHSSETFEPAEYGSPKRSSAEQPGEGRDRERNNSGSRRDRERRGRDKDRNAKDRDDRGGKDREREKDRDRNKAHFDRPRPSAPPVEKQSEPSAPPEPVAEGG